MDANNITHQSKPDCVGSACKYLMIAIESDTFNIDSVMALLRESKEVIDKSETSLPD
jgi:hypothetical protein